jgi:hypothetical protein
LCELGRGKGKDEALPLPGWLLSFDLFSSFFLVIPFFFSSPVLYFGEVGVAVAQHNIAMVTLLLFLALLSSAWSSPHLTLAPWCSAWIQPATI